jgi:hypothetical protein
MKTKHVILIFAFLATLFGFSSCQWHTIQPGVIDIPDEISFANDLESAFNDKCASCHSSGSLDLSTGNAYSTLIDGGFVNTSNPESSSIYTKMNDDRHPSESGTFSDTELALLLAWIEDGALDN